MKSGGKKIEKIKLHTVHNFCPSNNKDNPISTYNLYEVGTKLNQIIDYLNKLNDQHT
jgi:hypothetical protein